MIIKNKDSHPEHSNLEKVYLGAGGLGKPEQKKKKKLLSLPVKSIDLTEIDSVSDLVDGYTSMSIQARALGKCALYMRIC
ncbi:hypothetical protein LR003_01865 [candidate division NPL-UPA2 bacterium]|nr:hypothetical protein [candidate division NPL-UPA2 bacterium]